MPLLRIVKEYNKRSPLRGVVQTDVLTFSTRDEGMAWVRAVNSLNLKNKIDWVLIDYEWSLIASSNSEILANPTGGFVGKLAKHDS